MFRRVGGVRPVPCDGPAKSQSWPLSNSGGEAAAFLADGGWVAMVACLRDRAYPARATHSRATRPTRPARTRARGRQGELGCPHPGRACRDRSCPEGQGPGSGVARSACRGMHCHCRDRARGGSALRDSQARKGRHPGAGGGGYPSEWHLPPIRGGDGLGPSLGRVESIRTRVRARSQTQVRDAFLMSSESKCSNDSAVVCCLSMRGRCSRVAGSLAMRPTLLGGRHRSAGSAIN